MYHMSGVACQMPGVRCQVSCVLFFGQSCGASGLRFCYQGRGAYPFFISIYIHLIVEIYWVLSNLVWITIVILAETRGYKSNHIKNIYFKRASS